MRKHTLRSNGSKDCCAEDLPILRELIEAGKVAGHRSASSVSEVAEAIRYLTLAEKSSL